MNAIKLPRPIFNELLHLLQSAPDEEICGLISGDHNGPKRCYPVKNVAVDKRRLFELDPIEQIDVMRQMRANSEKLIAIYHSHPHGPALPSPIDIRLHQYPDVLYLIISLNTEGGPEMRGFYLRDRQVEEIDIGL